MTKVNYVLEVLEFIIENKKKILFRRRKKLSFNIIL